MKWLLIILVNGQQPVILPQVNKGECEAAVQRVVRAESVREEPRKNLALMCVEPTALIQVRAQ